MKIRNGFVSNSSSSSFIVACHPKQTKFTMHIDVDIVDYGEEEYDNLKDFIEYQLQWYESEDEIPQEIIEKAEKVFNEGKVIYVGRFESDSDNPLEQFLCENGIPKDTTGITIFKNEEGF